MDSIHDFVEVLLTPSIVQHVKVEGRLIPALTGFQENDRTFLVVDGRFTIGVPHELAGQVAWLTAQALAIGAGYSHLGALTKDRPFAPEIAELSGLPA